MLSLLLATVIAASPVSDSVPQKSATVITENAEQKELDRCLTLVRIGCVQDDEVRFPPQPKCCNFQGSNND